MNDGPKQTTIVALPGEEITEEQIQKMHERSKNTGPWRCSWYWRGVDEREKREKERGGSS